jgi:DNA-binding transcriptional regulator LsrR (DeoR family)
MAPADLVRAKELLASPGLKAADVAAMLKVSERTLFRELRAARDREEVGV